jgi:cell division protein FtsX
MVVVVMMAMMMMMIMMMMLLLRFNNQCSPQTQNKPAITTTMGTQVKMPMQQDSWPPCLYWQLLVFIFGNASWLQATA